VNRTNKEIALEYVDVMWNRHDLDRGLAYVTPELASSDAIEHATQALDAFSDHRVDILEPGPIAAGDLVVLRVAVNPTHDPGHFAGRRRRAPSSGGSRFGSSASRTA